VPVRSLRRRNCLIGNARVLGCRVDTIGPEEAVREVIELARGPKPSLVVTLGTEMVVRAQSDERFREAINQAALSLCDTAGVELAVRFSGKRVPRVTGVELVDALARACAREELSLFLLGAKGDTAQRAAGELKRRYPQLRIAGYCDGYFDPREDAAVAQSIGKCRPNVLLVALGFPRQELWIADNLGKTGAGVGIGVGGSFDVFAGNVERAPEFWRNANLEWLYRLVKEPQRWRRQLALPYFAWLVFLERFGIYRAGRVKA
jgi:N-acetylglucosaminyldiphosphoundecaprenol N-acetyl-beta-D-mannosaminyltransferase